MDALHGRWNLCSPIVRPVNTAVGTAQHGRIASETGEFGNAVAHGPRVI